MTTAQSEMPTNMVCAPFIVWYKTKSDIHRPKSGWLTYAVKLPPIYPFQRPSVRLLSPVMHPNVFRCHGDVCLDVLEMGSWSPAKVVVDMMQSVDVLLCVPQPECPVEVDVSIPWSTGDQAVDERVAQRTAEALDLGRPPDACWPAVSIPVSSGTAEMSIDSAWERVLRWRQEDVEIPSWVQRSEVMKKSAKWLESETAAGNARQEVNGDCDGE